MAFEAAIGEVDITPVHPPFPSLWMGGYGWGPRGNNGAIGHRLRAQCLALYDDGVPNVLLRADLVSIPADVHRLIRNTVVAEGLVADSDFMMNFSHTHSGPYVGDQRPDPHVTCNLNSFDVVAVNHTTSMLSELLIQLVRDTLTRPRTPVELSFGETNADIGFNRAGLDTVLDTVPVVLLHEGGSPFGVLFGAACHAVARGNDIVFDSDFPGVAAEAIEDALGVPALFFQGAAGDQEPHGPHSPAMAETLGHRLADAVVDRIRAGGLNRVTGPIASRLIEVRLPFSVDNADPAVRQALRDQFQHRHDTLPTGDPGRRHADRMLAEIDNGVLPTHFPMPVQRWRFGGLTLLGMAHEVLSVYDVALRQRFRGRLWVMGYTNEIEGYVPGDQTLWNGGYEAGWTSDPSIAGDLSATVPYAWPSPLKASPPDVTPPVAGSAQRIVVDACVTLLTT